MNAKHKRLTVPSGMNRVEYQRPSLKKEGNQWWCMGCGWIMESCLCEEEMRRQLRSEQATIDHWKDNNKLAKGFKKR